MNNDRRFPFKLALNTSTLIPFNLDVKQQITIAAEAGYDGIELWVRDIEAYLHNGGTLSDLKQYINDTGIAIVNGIAFFAWADADDDVRKQALKQAEREMQMLAELGCIGIAAAPFGNVATVSLDDMARYYAQVAHIAQTIGIAPYIEFWGRAKKLSRMSEAVYIAIESGVQDAQILFDLFHMYTGGSPVEALRLIDGSAIGIVHVNDYPADPSREVIEDKDRVFPGDGIGPTEQFAQLLHQAGFSGYLSLEIFKQSYGAQSALEVAVEGLEKVKNAHSIST